MPVHAMFHLLQHPPRSPERAPIGAGVSVAVHVALVASLLAGSAPSLMPSNAMRESIIESALRYLLPPDHPAAARTDERANWSASQAGAAPVAAPDVYSESRKAAGTPRPAAEDGAAPVPLAEAAAAENAFTLLDVDTVAVRDPTSAVPAYPRLLERQGIEGVAVVRFVVDSTGRADLETFRIIETNHPLFGAAVRDALPGMKFHAATVGPRKVRQMVELPFGFQLVQRGATDAGRKPRE